MPHTALLLLAIGLGGCARHEGTRFQGYVEGEYVYLASSQPGHLTQLSVARGDTLRAGAPVFALEAQNESDAVQQAEGDLKAAESSHADLLTGKRPPEVDVVAAQLAAARVDAERTATQARRDAEQFRADGIARAQLDDSQAAAASAAAKVRELEAQLTVARLPGRSEQIAAQAAQVRAAQAALAAAQWRLDQKSVHAPQAGLVFDTMYRSGEWVAAGSPVVRMLPPGNILVRFFVPETAVGGIAVGRRARIRCDGCAAPIDATVSFVSDQAEYTPPVIYSNETRAKLIFMIEARPAAADALKLHPGQPVEVILP